MKYLPILILVLLLTACGGGMSSETANSIANPAHPRGTVVRDGDLVYIAVNLPGLPQANIEALFKAVHDWEKKNPNYDVVGTPSFVWMQNNPASNATDYTYGVYFRVKSVDG